jgi:hypothetical protein
VALVEFPLSLLIWLLMSRIRPETLAILQRCEDRHVVTAAFDAQVTLARHCVACKQPVQKGRHDSPPPLIGDRLLFIMAQHTAEQIFGHGDSPGVLRADKLGCACFMCPAITHVLSSVLVRSAEIMPQEANGRSSLPYAGELARRCLDRQAAGFHEQPPFNREVVLAGRVLVGPGLGR